MRLTIILFIAAWCPAQDIVAKDPRAAETGRWMFRIRCAPCHGIHADGGRGPDLTLGAYAAGDRDGDLFRVISRGVPGTEMAAYAGRVEDEDIWRLVAYIRSVARSDQVTIKATSRPGKRSSGVKADAG